MPLPPLNWRFVGFRSFTSGIANAHDAVYDLGTSLTYQNGTVRTPGTGSAWTWNREQVAGVTEAVYGKPPTNTLGMQYILAGNTASTAWPAAGSTTKVANNIIAGMGQNTGGGYVGPWTAANPFGAGTFTSYWNASMVFSASAYNSVRMWESQEACFIQYAISGTGATTTTAFGALIDPLVYVPGATCQTDNRLYFMSVGGRLVNASATWLTDNQVDGAVFGGVATLSNNTAKCGFIWPEPTSGFSGSYACKGVSYSPSANLLTAGGEVVVVPFTLIYYNNSTNGPQQLLGVTREFGVVKDSATAAVWTDSGVERGYTIGYHTATAGDAILLKA